MIVLNGIAVRAASRAPMQLRETASITAESGVEGDLRGRPGRRQVTVLSAGGWRAACEALGTTLEWTARRANLLIDGLTFDPSHAGAIIRIGDVELQITQETTPCSRMEQACPGLKNALKPEWRGGVCCRVLQPGRVALGDAVAIEKRPRPGFFKLK
jgi:MOSC domain-containing protein YiiM